MLKVFQKKKLRELPGVFCQKSVLKTYVTLIMKHPNTHNEARNFLNIDSVEPQWLLLQKVSCFNNSS